MTNRDETVGFIGLGVMGSGMAANVPAGSCAEVARRASKVICMVDTTDAARAVIAGPGGIIENAEDGDTIVCMSTLDPVSVREMHDAAAERGMRITDVTPGTVATED